MAPFRRLQFAFAVIAILVVGHASEAQEKPAVADEIWKGRIIDDKWRPLEGATVRAKWTRVVEDSPGAVNPMIRGTQTKSDTDGQYQIVVPAGLAQDPAVRLDVTVFKSGYLRRSVPTIKMAEPATSDLVASQRRLLRQLQLRRGRVITGRVLHSDGSPAAKAEVIVATKYRPYSWKFPDENHYHSVGTALTDENGRYEVVGDSEANMRVRPVGHAEYTHAALPDANPLTHNVRLPESVRAHGRVTDADGNPVPLAIVRFRRSSSWDEFNMPLGLQRYAIAGADGGYSMPALPPGVYTVSVNSRLADPARRKELTAAAESGNYISERALHQRLTTVIPETTVTLTKLDRAPSIDLSGVPTNTITVAIEHEQPGKAAEKRAPLIAVTGVFQGKRWSGYSLPLAPNPAATFLVPSGVESVAIKTGYALVRGPGEKEFRRGDGIYINRVRSDVSDYGIRLQSLATINVKIKVPDRLRISKVGTLSVFLTDCPVVDKTTKKYFGRMHIRGSTTDFTTVVPPGVDYWLHIHAKEKPEYSRKLRFKPGETRQLDVNLAEQNPVTK